MKTSLLVVLVVLLGACNGSGSKGSTEPAETPPPEGESAATTTTDSEMAPEGPGVGDETPGAGANASCPEIHPPAPGLCKQGNPVAKKDPATGCVTGYECPQTGAATPQAQPCPELHPPAPGFCKQGGKPVPKKDPQSGCITGYECK